MSSTRDRILQTLLRQPRRTINDLAEAVGINPISVRHHLTSLQVEGLVTSEEERHGVGRPRLLYALTRREWRSSRRATCSSQPGSCPR